MYETCGVCWYSSKATPENLSSAQKKMQTPELREGSKLVSPTSQRTYTIIKGCGRGSFGTVYKCKASDSGNLFALKLVDTLHAKDQLDMILQEIAVTQKAHRLSDNRSPQTHEAFVIQTPTKGKNRQVIVIVMDYIDGITLSALIADDKPLCETMALHILHEVASGLIGMHAHGLIHRDIKSANILLSRSGEVYLCDFGVSKVISECSPATNTLSGTPLWMAPEMISGKPYNEAVDLYSLGITAVEIVTGHPPVPTMAAGSENNQDIMNGLRSRARNIPVMDKRKFSKEFREIITACLTIDPNARMSASSLLDRVNACFQVSTNPIAAGSGSISSAKTNASHSAGSFNLKHALGELVKLNCI